jgi:hypothetical protein
MSKESEKSLAAKKKNAKLNIWHRLLLTILEEEGTCDSETLVVKAKERKAYHSASTLRGYISTLNSKGLIEEVETERVRDSGGRMTIRVWRLPTGTTKAPEIETKPKKAKKKEVKEAGFSLTFPKKNHGRMMNIWHRAMLDILKEGPLSKTALIEKVKDHGAYQSDQTLRGYVTDLKNRGLIEAVDDIREATKGGRMSILIWKLVEAPDPSPETAQVNESVKESGDGNA